MKCIYKYPLKPPGEVAEIPLPAHAQVRHADVQGDQFCLWVELNTDLPPFRERLFRIYATGEPFDRAWVHIHINTVLVGQYVWHIYELLHPYDGN